MGGGAFSFAGTGPAYFCDKANGFSPGEINGARGICTGAFRGLFFADNRPGEYSCYVFIRGQV